MENKEVANRISAVLSTFDSLLKTGAISVHGNDAIKKVSGCICVLEEILRGTVSEEEAEIQK